MVVHDVRIQRVGKIRNAKNFATIQEAIDSLPAEGGDVFIPEGTYTINAPITVPSDVILRGAGYNTIIFLAANSNCDLIQNNDVVGGNEHIIIENIQLDGNSENQTTEYSCIYFYKADKCCVRGCWVHDTITGGLSTTRGCCIFLDDSDDNIIENNYCWGGGYDNISIRNGSLRNAIKNNVTFGAVITSGIQAAKTTKNGITPPSKTLIMGNICHNNTSSGIKLHGTTECIVLGNVCHNNGYHGMHILGGCARSIIEGNTIHANIVGGILAEDLGGGEVSNLIIKGNMIYLNTGSGIYLRGIVSNVIVEGNTCLNNTTNGINLETSDVKYCIISNNECGYSGGRGIYSRGEGMSITGNICHDNVQSGMQLSTGTIYASVIGNVCYNNNTAEAIGESGIKLYAVTYSTISNNTCYDNQIPKKQEYGIFEYSGADFNMITNNICTDNLVRGIQITGFNDLVKDNIT